MHQFRAQTDMSEAALQSQSFRKPKPLNNFYMKKYESKRYDKQVQNSYNIHDFVPGKGLFKKLDSSVEDIGKLTLAQSPSKEHPDPDADNNDNDKNN